MFPSITTPPAATSTGPSHVYCANDERRYVLMSVREIERDIEADG